MSDSDYGYSAIAEDMRAYNKAQNSVMQGQTIMKKPHTIQPTQSQRKLLGRIEIGGGALRGKYT